MSTKPIVSVIVPAYNAERFLGDAVRSVLGQSWRDLELIIVNDGSSDGTAEAAERFAAGDPRVRVIHKTNGGLSSARNAGMAAARGELLCFLDADDALLPDKLERQVAFLDRARWCDLVYSDHYVGDGALTPLWLDCRRPPPIPMQELLVYKNWFAPMAPLMRAELRSRVGDFDEHLASAEDWDFWIRAARHGVFSYLAGPVGIYRSHSGQMHHDLRRMRSNQDRVIRKHFQPRSREWRITQAARAYGEAKRFWGRRDFPRVVACLFASLWHARSRRTFETIVALLRSRAVPVDGRVCVRSVAVERGDAPNPHAGAAPQPGP